MIVLYLTYFASMLNCKFVYILQINMKMYFMILTLLLCCDCHMMFSPANFFYSQSKLLIKIIQDSLKSPSQVCIH